MWGGFFEKGKEFGSKAKGLVQQFGDDILQNNNNVNPFQAFQVGKPASEVKKSPAPSPIPSANSIDALFSQEDSKEVRMKGLVEKATRLLKKITEKQTEIITKRTVVSEEVKEKFNSVLSQIVQENSNKFIGKVKQLLLERVSSRISLQIEEILGTELTEEHKKALIQVFNFEDEKISIFDSEFNVDSLETHFFSALELEEMKESLTFANSVNSEIKQLIEAQENYLKNDKVELLEKLKKSEEAIKTQKAEIDISLDSKKSLEQKLAQIQDGSSKLEKELKDLQTHSEKLATQLAQTNREKEKSFNDFEKSTITIKKQVETIKALENEKLQLEKDLDDAFDINRVLEKDIFNLNKKINESQDIPPLNEERNRNQTDESKDSKEDIENKLRNEINEIQKSLKESENQIDSLKAEIISISGQKSHEETLKIQDEQQKVSKLQEHLDCIQKEKEEIEKKNIDLQESLKNLTVDVIEGLRKEINEITEQKTSSEKQLDALQLQTSTLTKEKGIMEEEVRKLKEKLEKSYEEQKQIAERQKEEFNQLKNTLGNQETDFVINQIEKLNNEKLSLVENLRDSTSKIEELESQISANNSEILDQKEEILKNDVKLKSLEAEFTEKVDKLQLEIEKITNQLVELKTINEQISQNNIDLTNLNEQTKEQLTVLEQKLQENERISSEKQEEEISKKEKSDQEQTQGIEAYSKKIEEYETEINLLKSLNSETQQKILLLQDEISKQEINLSQLKEEQIRNDVDRNQLLEQLKSSQKQQQVLKQELDLLSNESTGKLQEEQSRRVATQKQLESQMIRFQEQSQDEIQSLLTKSQNESAALEKITAKLQKCEAELSKSSSELESATKKIEQNKQYIDQLRRGNKELLNITIDQVTATANEMDKADISKQIASINDCIKNSNPEIIKEFQRFLSETRKCLVDQYFYTATTIKNQEKVKFAKLSEQFDKSADEIKALNVKVKQLDKLEKQLLDVNEIIRVQKTSIKKSEDAFRDVQIELSSKEVQFSNIQEKLGQVQAKNEGILAENSFLKENSTRLQEAVTQLTNDKALLEEKLIESSDTGFSSREKDSQIAELEANLASLSNVHEEFQRRSETLARKYDAELKKIRAENTELKEKCLLSEELKLQIEQSENVITEKNAKIALLENKFAESEAERLEIRQETNNLLNKMKAESVKSEFLIDRRVISNFLVQYFDADSSNQVKLQILDTMSSILQFSDDEKVKVGIQKQKLGFLTQQAMQQKEQPKGFANKFISFLLAPDEEQPKK